MSKITKIGVGQVDFLDIGGVYEGLVIKYGSEKWG